MTNTNIVYSTSATATIFVSTSSLSSMGVLLLDTSADGTLTMTAGVTTVVTSSKGIPSTRISTGLSRPSVRVRFGRGLPIEATATRDAPRLPAIEEAEPSSRSDTGHAGPRDGEAGGPRDGSAETDTPPPPRKSARAEKIELAIDKLPNHELIKPIPVLIESLGDKVFIAEALDLEISITGNSMGGVLLQLKEHIANIYEGHRASNNLKPEAARQLKAMEAYIGRTRRNWF
jgi:hypothetical protein